MPATSGRSLWPSACRVAKPASGAPPSAFSTACAARAKVSGGAAGSRRRPARNRAGLGPRSRNPVTAPSTRLARVASTKAGSGRNGGRIPAVSPAKALRRGELDQPPQPARHRRDRCPVLTAQPVPQRLDKIVLLGPDQLKGQEVVAGDDRVVVGHAEV